MKGVYVYKKGLENMWPMKVIDMKHKQMAVIISILAILLGNIPALKALNPIHSPISPAEY